MTQNRQIINKIDQNLYDQQKTFNTLVDMYNTLLQQNKNLRVQNEDSKEAIKNYEEEHKKTSKRYEKLKEKHKTLRNKYNELEMTDEKVMEEYKKSIVSNNKLHRQLVQKNIVLFNLSLYTLGNFLKEYPNSNHAEQIKHLINEGEIHVLLFEKEVIKELPTDKLTDLNQKVEALREKYISHVDDISKQLRNERQDKKNKNEHSNLYTSPIYKIGSTQVYPINNNSKDIVNNHTPPNNSTPYPFWNNNLNQKIKQTTKNHKTNDSIIDSILNNMVHDKIIKKPGKG